MHGFRVALMAAVPLTGSLLPAAYAAAATVPLGIATGGVSVNFNISGPPGVPAWVKAQFSGANPNGAEFNFDSTPLPGTFGLVSWYQLFQAVPNQFGLDLQLALPGANGSNPAPPSLVAKNNVNGNVASATPDGTIDWAINGYTGPTDGPANPANGVINSLFRGGTGSGASITITSLSVAGPTLTIAGTLQSDNRIHWYNPGTGDTPIPPGFELTGKFFFNATLTLQSSGLGSAFYGGALAVDAEVLCGTRYVSPSPAGSDIVAGPAPNLCKNPAAPCATVQHAIDTACPGDTVNVRTGSYSETAPVPSPPACPGDTVGLYVSTAKQGLTIQGVTPGDVPITSASGAFLPTITTNSNLCFGPDGIFVEGDNVTIAGVRIGANNPTYGQNKTIEVVGDGFTLKHSDVADLGGSVYLNDSNFDTGANVSHVKAYRIEGNIFGDGVSLDIASGAGFSGPVAGRVITGNTFYNLATSPGAQPWPSISFNGSGTGVPWFVYSVGGAVITGNTFSNTAPDGQQIRARGTYNNAQFDWASYFTTNTFNRSVVFGTAPPATVGTYSYTSGSYTFNNVRRIGASIQGELDHAQNGDTVLVGKGFYPESPNVTTSVNLKSYLGRAQTTISLQTGPTYLGALTIGGQTVTVDGFTIVGRDGTPTTIAASNILVNPALTSVTIKNNRLRVGASDGTTGNGDDGIGILTTYATSAPDFVATLSITDNGIEPLNASGSGDRAFYINPGVVNLTMARNQITGRFEGVGMTQAKNGTVQQNVVDGLGQGGAGIGSWGYPDAAVWGHTTFDRNVLRGLFAGITVFESNNTVLSCNQFVGNTYGVRVRDGFGTANFNPTTLSITTNSIIGNATAGVANLASTAGIVPASGNWWGCVAGPPNLGCDAAVGSVNFTPVATSVPACASCSANSQCSDGVACNGTEQCTAGSCAAGTPVNCSGLTNQCNTGVCTEPSGTCVPLPKPDGTSCESGADTCSVQDFCVAGACPNNGGGGDPDLDDICSADDNCDLIDNGDQADIDGDGEGNVCDASEGAMNPYRIRFKGNFSATKDQSSVSVKGDFVVQLPGEAFPGGNGDFTIKINDSALPVQNVVSQMFTTADCQVSATKRKCLSADKHVKASFRTSPAQPKVWKFVVKVKPAGLGAGPFVGPAYMTLSYGPSVDRVGDVIDCVTNFTGMSCRQLR
jgi:hypothetical protein